MRTWRIVLAAAGALLALFGVFRLVTEISYGNLAALGVWLLAALILHDAVLAPAVVGTGWALRQAVPDRPRRYVQFALIMAALVTVIALPMIYLRGSQPAVKALLLRDYGANLLIIVGAIATVTFIVYTVRTHRTRRTSSRPAG